MTMDRFMSGLFTTLAVLSLGGMLLAYAGIGDWYVNVLAPWFVAFAVIGTGNLISRARHRRK